MDTFDQLIKRQVIPWSFMTAGPPFVIKRHDGSEIAYQGILFDGSARLVFWTRYIEPFMEEICVREIDEAVRQAKERHVDARQLLPEVQGLLLAGIRKTYQRMVDVDRRLRGRGFPQSVEPRDAKKEYGMMEEFVDVRIRSELSLWRRPSKLSIWYNENTGLAWLIGSLIGMLAVVAAFAAG